MGHDTLGQEMGFYFILADQFAQAGSLADMAGDYFSYKTLVAKMVHPFDISEGVVAAAAAMGKGEITGRSRFQEAFFNGQRHLLGKTAHARRGPGYRRPVFDQLRRLPGAHYFGHHLYLLSDQKNDCGSVPFLAVACRTCQ
jgi:hypothetical protein